MKLNKLKKMETKDNKILSKTLKINKIKKSSGNQNS